MSKKTVSVSFPLFPISFIIFVGLFLGKLFGGITIGWLWVFAPLWLPPVAFFVFFGGLFSMIMSVYLIFIGIVLGNEIHKNHKNNKDKK